MVFGIFLHHFFFAFFSRCEKSKKIWDVDRLSCHVTLVMVNLTVLFVLGPTIASKVFPLMNATRYISLAEFFENLESIAMAVWIVGAFVKISVYYYVVALGTAQWLNLSDYRPIIWPLAIIIIEFAFWSIPSSAEYTTYFIKVLPFYGPFVQTIIPLFLLMVAMVRKKNPKAD